MKTVFLRNTPTQKIAVMLEEEALGVSRISLPLAMLISRAERGMVDAGRYTVAWETSVDGKTALKFYDKDYANEG